MSFFPLFGLCFCIDFKKKTIQQQQQQSNCRLHGGCSIVVATMTNQTAIKIKAAGCSANIGTCMAARAIELPIAQTEKETKPHTYRRTEKKSIGAK